MPPEAYVASCRAIAARGCVCRKPAASNAARIVSAVGGCGVMRNILQPGVAPFLLQDIQEGPSINDLDPLVGAKIEKISVTGHDVSGLALSCRGQEFVIVRVARHRWHDSDVHVVGAL